LLQIFHRRISADARSILVAALLSSRLFSFIYPAVHCTPWRLFNTTKLLTFSTTPLLSFPGPFDSFPTLRSFHDFLIFILARHAPTFQKGGSSQMAFSFSAFSTLRVPL
jgi:hypothetical protein